MGVFGIGGRGKDDGEEKGKLKLDPAQAAKALPLLVALLALLGIWCLASGALRIRDDARHAGLQVARDDAVMAARRTLNDERGRLAQRLGADRVKAALATGDSAATLRLLRQGWPELQRAELWPADLTAAYAGLPRTGFGALATCEAALAEGKPVARVVKSAGVQRLALAAPVVGGSGPMVAYVELPLEKLASGVEAPTVPSDTYLALRQGSRNVLERGDTSLGNSAEALAIKVPDSDLRIAASTPDATATPFELGGMPAVGLGAILVLLSAWLWVIVRPRLLGLRGNDGADAEPTLADLQRDQPAPEPAVREKVAEDSKTDAVPVAIDRGIFRAYDIRGVMGQTLDASVAELIGQAVGSLMFDQGLDEIVVGRDGRLSGPELAEGLIAGLRKAGRNVIDLGMVPTPVVYFGCYHLRTGCGVSITGSHNPPDYNGFKIVVGGETLSGNAILDLHARIAEDRLLETKTPGGAQRARHRRRLRAPDRRRHPGRPASEGRGRCRQRRGRRRWGRACWRPSAPTSPRCSATSTAPSPTTIRTRASRTTWKRLMQMVQRLDADLGIAFDGDGDRLGVVTKSGEYIYPDRLLMLFAADVLERNPGAVIVYDVKCTGHLPTHILRHGGSPLMWKTGHSLIKAKMRETEAELAGEMSGHFFFAERWFGFDDGIYAAARLLEILDAGGMSPEEALRHPARRHFHPGAQGRSPRWRAACVRRPVQAGGEVRGRAPVDPGRAARGLAGRLGPGACVQHHAECW
jgi:phosphomannomutase/phosphoglucomutase